jgi:mono/diheme cytochrome c family protein
MTYPNAVRALRARPLAVIAVVLAVVAFTNAMLVGCGGSQSNNTEGQSQTSSGTESTPEATTPPPAGGTAVASGAEIYTQRCALCHGPGGHGDGPAAAGLNPKPRNHTDGSYMNARTDEDLLTVIREGKGAMPAWKAVLSDEEIHAVLKHVRTLAVPPYSGGK